MRSPQSLTNLPAYCAKDELTTLMSGDINLARVTIAQRLRKVGLTSMKEDTKRAAVALEVQSFLWRGMPRPSKAQQLSKLFLSDLTTSPVSPVKTYPSLPTGLGAEWISKVYGSDRPSLMHLPGYAALQIDCPVRETHRLLSWNQKKELVSPNRRGRAGVGGMNLHGCMQNTFFGGQGGLANLKVFDKKPASAMENLALARQQLRLPALGDRRTNAPAQLSLASTNPNTAQSSSAAAQPCIANSGSSAEQIMQADPTSAASPSRAAEATPGTPEGLVQISHSLQEIQKSIQDKKTAQTTSKSLEDYELEKLALVETKKDASAKRLKRKTAPADPAPAEPSKASKAEAPSPRRQPRSTSPRRPKLRRRSPQLLSCVGDARDAGATQKAAHPAATRGFRGSGSMAAEHGKSTWKRRRRRERSECSACKLKAFCMHIMIILWRGVPRSRH